MKKTLLGCGFILAALAGQAQVTTYVTQPAELEGPLEFTWADAWGQTPDLNDPANSVTAFAAMGRDATEADTLGCEAFINPEEIAGKIAVIYRGVCEFGTKAFNAQAAGAVGVIIINNQGAPIAMGAGVQGPEVTIPVVMISTDAGSAIYDALIAGELEVLIGSVQGVYEFNVHTSKDLAFIPQYSAMPGALASGIGFSVNMGSWVKNFGFAEATGVELNCTITNNGSTVYDETSTAASIPVQDSAFFGLPAFSQANYSGLYEATYTITTPNTDGFPSDDVYTWNFYAGDVFAYSRIDPTTLLPIGEQHIRTVDGAEFLACSYFSHPNASNYQVEGVYTSAAKSGGASMQDELLESRVYQWSDVFNGWADATTTSITLLDNGEYTYAEDLSEQTIYIPFNAPVILEDNTRYLFCSYSPSAEVFLGFGESLNYTRLQTELDEPIYLMADGPDAWSFFANADHSAVGAKLTQIVGVNDRDRVELTPYPNPTNNQLNIPIRGMSGAALLRVMDLAGAQVMEEKVSVGADHNLVIDMAKLANGTYLFHMDFENGQRSDFRVVVAK